MGVKASRPSQQGAGGGLDLGSELGGGVPRTAVSLASQPLALIRLIPWPLLFLVKLNVSVSCLFPSLVLEGMALDDRPTPPCPGLGVRTPGLPSY